MSDSSEDSTPPRKKKTSLPTGQLYRQKWRQAWTTEPLFAGWLKKSAKSKPSKDLAFCTICNADISCGKSEIMRHASSQRHKNLSMQQKQNKNLASFVLENDPIEKAARKIELKICSFLSEHYLSISLCEPLLMLLKSMFPDQTALKRVSLGKQRTSNIIRQVFGNHLVSDLCAVLRERMFAVIVDETTDRSTTKQMTIICQYYENCHMKDSFLDMVEVHDSSARGLFQSLKQCFSDHQIPLKNVVAFCSDTTNVMMGNNHSVATLLRDELPNIIIVKCSCHMIHLCASYACLKLPKSLEDLCRNIFTHFNLSSKRQDAFKEFQNFVGVEPHKILSPGQTRWLSLEQCVQRLLEQWDALTLYFTELSFSDPTNSNDAIVAELSNKITRAYLEFLQHNLSRLNAFNTQFQSETPNFYCLREEVSKLIRNICSDFMSVPYVKKCSISDLNPNNPLFSANMVSDERMYLGLKAMDTVHDLKSSGSTVKDEEITKYYHSCRQFLIESVKQIQARFSDDDGLHKILQCLRPQNAINLEPPSLSKLFDAIPQLSNFVDRKKTDEEWRSHHLLEELSSQLSCTDYWNIVFSQRNAANLPCFPNLKVVMSTLLSLPFSNASVERCFSKLNLIKNKQRTKLKNETLKGLMHMIYHLKNNLTSDRLDTNAGMIAALRGVKSNATCNEVSDM